VIVDTRAVEVEYSIIVSRVRGLGIFWNGMEWYDMIDYNQK